RPASAAPARNARAEDGRRRRGRRRPTKDRSQWGFGALAGETMNESGETMTLRKFVSMLFALTLVLAVACGKGKEAANNEEEGEDDQAGQTASAGNTAGTAAPASTAAPVANAAVSADAATINGMIKLEGTAPKMAPLQMAADPYCQSQHPNGVDATDEEVVVGPAGEL